jgi:hypothetical protein
MCAARQPAYFHHLGVDDEETIAMQGNKRSRGVLVALAASGGAFGAAAMMSAATAPTARADDFTEIIANVETIEGYGQAAFSAADVEFASNNVPLGLALLFDGTYDDTVGVQDEISIGTLAALGGGMPPAPTSLDFNSVPFPTSYADAVTDAQSDYATAATAFTAAVTDLSGGDYGGFVLESATVPVYAFDLPVEQLFIGAVEALGL